MEISDNQCTRFGLFTHGPPHGSQARILANLSMSKNNFRRDTIFRFTPRVLNLSSIWVAQSISLINPDVVKNKNHPNLLISEISRAVWSRRLNILVIFGDYVNSLYDSQRSGYPQKITQIAKKSRRRLQTALEISEINIFGWFFFKPHQDLSGKLIALLKTTSNSIPDA